MRPLTQRDMRTLGELRAATDNFMRCDNHKEGWVMPMDCGGYNGSHHSYTLHKLSKRGLCDRKKYGGAPLDERTDFTANAVTKSETA